MRIFLIKFLSDEVLSSAILRDHLDRCASVSADLQQKLRLLTSEWKVLKSREEIQAANPATENINDRNGGGEFGSDALPSVILSDGQEIGRLSSRSNCISSSAANFLQLEDGQHLNGSNNYNKQQSWSFGSLPDKACPSNSIQIIKAYDTIGQLSYQQPVKDHSPASQSLSFHTRLSKRGDNCQHDISLSTPQQNSNFNGEISWSNLNSQASNHGSCNGSVLSSSQVIPGRSSSDTIGSHVAECVPSMHVNFSQAHNCETSSLLKNEISCLQNSIATLESELFKVSVRKEFMGRDSAGRLYWVFGSLGTSAGGVVNGSLTAQQSKVKDLGGSTENNSRVRNSYLFAVESPSSSRGLSFSNMCAAEKNMESPVSSSWSYYQSDAEIEELVGWLTNNDARERELRESILHWHQNKLTDSNDAKNHFQDEIQQSPLNSSISGKSLDSNFLGTNAVTALEKKFGCFQVLANNIPEQQGYKAEETCQDRMYRCECLEPLWPSKHHCFSCHRTFSTCEDLDEHSNGTCSPSLPVPECSQVNGDPSKHKRIRTETSFEKSSDLRIVKASKSENHKSRSCFSEKNDPACPFDFEEIRTKFVTQNLLKDVVKEVGLIGSNGTPSFVPKISPYLVDPALSLVPAMKNEDSSSNASKDLKNQQAKRKANITDALNTGHIANRLFKRPENGMDEDPSKVDRSNSKCMGGKDQLSSTKKMLRGGKFAIIRESSLRPLVGRVSAILMRLKINLLDMDAALPEEALRPSRANSEKRCIWRAFVKSAESIHEMSQATIVLEDMIKTAYLRNDWCYWSSPSASAKISTLSALALRICTLDAAIIYEKTVPCQDPSEICKSIRESLSISSLANLRPSSARLRKALNSDPADCSKLKSRSSKRRKDSGG